MMTSSSCQKYTSKLHSASILILGGTSGIGYAVAEACLEQYSVRLTISGSQQPEIDRTIARLRATYSADSFPTKLSGHACDPSHLEQLENNLTSLLAFATDSGTAKLDHVINTAGDSFSTHL
jgi:NAD(P)-dependent dehydrogenase (short-subunit alcohol dehydrogenase family)